MSETTKLNLDPNLAGALCYAFGCISGIIFFVLETDNKRVRFHALQSILLFAGLSILCVISIILTIVTDFFVFEVANSLIWLLQFVLWIVLIIKTYQGQTIKIPGLGDFAQQQAGWPEKES